MNSILQFCRAACVAGVLLVILLGSVFPAQAQEPVNWLVALEKGQVEVRSGQGQSAWGAHPVIVLEIANLGQGPLALAFESGDVLRPDTAGYCSVVLAGTDEAVTIPAGAAATVELDAYCLELPEETHFPDRHASFVPLHYEGQVDRPVHEVLARAKEAGLLDDYATVLAVWQVQAALSFDDLAVAVSLANPDFYRDQVAFLAEGKGSPVVTPAVTAVVPTATPPSPRPTPLPGRVRILGMTVRWQPLLIVGGVVCLLVLAGLLGFGLRAYLWWKRQDPRPSLSSILRSVQSTPRPVGAPANKEGPARPPAAGMDASTASVGSKGGGEGVAQTEATVEETAAAEIPRCPICGQPGHAAQACPALRPDYGLLDQSYRGTRPLVDEFPGLDPAARLAASAEIEADPPALGLGIYYDIQMNGRSIGRLPEQGGLLTREDFSRRQVAYPSIDTISTPHAVLRLTKDGRAWLRDLCSRNGTFVHEQLLPPGQEVEVLDGAIVGLGPQCAVMLDLRNRRLVSRTDLALSRSLRSTGSWLITRYHVDTVAGVDPTLSNPHLLIRPNGPDNLLDVLVRDLGSRNGTRPRDNGLLRIAGDGEYASSGEIELDAGQRTYRVRVCREPGVEWDQIGEHYTVRARVHCGEMSEIYLVRDTRDRLDKALKLPHLGGRMARGAVVQAIQREERVSRLPLAHPALAVAEGWGQETRLDVPYLVMPYVDGLDLGKLLARMRAQARAQAHGTGEGLGLSTADAGEIVYTLLEALQDLHDHGWVHCDLKPGNVLIGRNGRVYLIDYGSATPLGETATSGTLDYSPREVLARDMVDGRSDVYSVGRLLFVLLSGYDPRALGVPRDVRSSMLLEPLYTRSGIKAAPRVLSERELRHQLDDDALVELVLRATARDPEQRFQDVQEMRAALGAALRGRDGSSPDLQRLVEQYGPPASGTLK